MSTKFFVSAVLLSLCMATAAVADMYNFTFTGNNGMDATGTITILGGVAQSGSINVTGVPIEAFPYTLINAAVLWFQIPRSQLYAHQS